MIKEAIVKIVGKQDLTYDEAYAVMNEIMSGETTPTQNAAFLAALSTKSAKAETTDEIAGCAAAMRDHAVKVNPGMDVLEIVGTGGDGAHSFNISTTSALDAALAKPGLSFICECKKASPSKGLIAPEFPYLQIARDYEAAGAMPFLCSPSQNGSWAATNICVKSLKRSLFPACARTSPWMNT